RRPDEPQPGDLVPVPVEPLRVEARFEPASRLTAAGCKARVARTSGTISTIAVPVADPVVAVTSPRPTCVEAFRTPDASIVPMPPVAFQTKLRPWIVFP